MHTIRVPRVVACILGIVVLALVWSPSYGQSTPSQMLTELQAMLNRADELYKQKRYRDAFPLYEKAQNLIDEQSIQDKAVQAQALFGLARRSVLSGDTGKSLDFSKQALEIYRQLGNITGQARALGMLGLILNTKGHYQEALTDCEGAVRLFVQLGDEAGQANTLTNTGNVYYNLGELDTALIYYHRALPLHKKVENRLFEAHTEANLARVYLQHHQYQDAEQFLRPALEIYRLLREKSEEAQALNNLGNCRAGTAHYTEAFEFYKQARALYEQIPNAKGIAEVLANYAYAHFNIGQLDAACTEFDQALNLYRQLRNPEKEADILNLIGSVQYQAGRLELSLNCYQQALSLYQNIDEATKAANSWNGIGSIYTDTGQLPKALEAFQQALAIYRAQKDEQGEADSLSNIGSYFAETGKMDQAVAYSLRALKIHEQVKNYPSQGHTLDNLGVIFARDGQLQKALAYFHRAFTVYEQIQDADGQATVLTNLGGIYMNFGQPEQGFAMFQQALRLFHRIGNRRREAAVLTDIGASCHVMGDRQQAPIYFQRAIEIAREIGDRSGEAIAQINLGYVCLNAGQAQRALEPLDRAKSLLQRSPYKWAEAYYLNNLAYAHSLLGHSQMALDYEFQALNAFKQAGYLDGIATVQGNIGRDYAALGQTQKAIAAYKQSIALFESIRGNLGAQDEMKSGYLSDHLGIYLRYLNLLLQQHKDTDAFAIAEKTKGRNLLDILQNGKLDITQGLTAAEKERASVLRQVMTSLQTKWIKASYHNDTGTIATLKPRMEKAAQELQFYTDELYSHHPQLAQRRAAKTITLGEVAGFLPSDTAILEYVVLRTGTGKQTLNKVVLMVVTCANRHPSLAVYTLAIGAEKLAVQAEAFRAACADPKSLEYRARGLNLFSQLLPPGVERRLAERKVKRLIVCPDGPLWDLPFAALLNQKGFLWEQYELAYAYSATGLKAALEARAFPHSQRQRTLLALGDPAFGGNARIAPIRSGLERLPSEIQPAPLTAKDVPSASEGSTVGWQGNIYLPRGGGLSPLPNTRVEVQNIAKLFPDAAVKLGEEAQERTVKQEGSSYKFLHIASHGFFNDVAPLLSNIALAQPPPDDTEDGFLSAREIGDMSLAADMVVLSGCETGRGQKRRGEGVVGFTWALFIAGCPTQVVSHWKVEDASTSQLMARFYSNIVQRKMEKASALREASLWLMHSAKNAKYAHPAYWSPFFLVGDWR